MKPSQAERKKKKSGAAESHEKIAQKLLAAQLRKEALSHAKRYALIDSYSFSTLTVVCTQARQRIAMGHRKVQSHSMMIRSIWKILTQQLLELQRKPKARQENPLRLQQRKPNGETMIHIDCLKLIWKPQLRRQLARLLQIRVLRLKMNYASLLK